MTLTKDSPGFERIANAKQLKILQIWEQPQSFGRVRHQPVDRKLADVCRVANANSSDKSCKVGINDVASHIIVACKFVVAECAVGIVDMRALKV